MKKFLSLVLTLTLLLGTVAGTGISTGAYVAPDDEQGRNAFAVNDIYVSIDDGTLEEGFFENYIRVDYNLTGDGESLITTLGQTVVIDTSVLEPVSYEDGTSILDACKTTDAVQFGTTDIALNAADNKIGRKTYTYGFGSTGLTYYNANTGNLYIFICGLHTDGVPLPANPTRVGSIFLKLAEGKTNADVKGAIWLMKNSEDSDPVNGCAAPEIYPNAISTKQYNVVKVPTTNISFSDDFNIPFNITFNWKDADGDKTATQTVYEGEMPAVPEGADANYSDSDYDYTFTGWDKEIVPAAQETVYTAQYAKSADKSELSATYAECLSLDEENYTEESWTPFAQALSAANDVLMDDDATYGQINGARNALLEAKGALQTKPEIVVYEITFKWKDADGDKSTTLSVNAGNIPEAPALSDYSSADGNYSYTFTGWDKDIEAATESTTYTAQYDTTVNYADYAAVDNAVSAANELICADDYEAKYTEASRNALTNALNAVVRDKLASEQSEVDVMAEDITAAINALEIAKYDITFSTHNGDNTIQVNYGEMPEAPAGATDGYSEGDYDYAFTAWDSEIAPVTDNTTYTAQYEGSFIAADYAENEAALAAAAQAFADAEAGGFTYTEETLAVLNAALENNVEAGLGRTRQSDVDDATAAINAAVNALVPMCRHQYEQTKIVPAGCETEGSVTYTCSVCGDEYTQTIPALNHVWNEGVVTKEPTCARSGVKTFTCTACGSSYTEIIPATGEHNYETVVTEATCTHTGYTVYTCTECAYTYTDDFTALTPHEFESVVVAPTCAEKGYTLKSCKNCAYSIKTDFTDITDEHNYETVVTEATCTHTGYTVYTCADCGHSYIGEPTQMKAHEYEATVVEPTTETRGYTVYVCKNCANAYVSDITEILPSNMHYILPELESRTTTVTVKSDAEEYAVTSLEGDFKFNGLSDGMYRVYVSAQKSPTQLIEQVAYTENESIEKIINDLDLPIGDVNGDNIIDVTDISILLASENYTTVNSAYDISGDDYIDVTDITIILLRKNYAKVGVEII